MKRLLSGVAFAALIAAPVWAQTPNNNPSNPNTPSGNPPATAQAPAASQNAQGTETSKPATRKEAAAPKAGKHQAMRHGGHMNRHMAKARHGQRMQMAHWRHGHRMHAMWHAGMPRHGMYRQYSWSRPAWGYRTYAGWGWGPKHASTDFMAAQLNRQELGQVYTGSSMPAGPQPYAPMGY
jgi:Ni/Co efflux regulator RcnB